MCGAGKRSDNLANPTACLPPHATRGVILAVSLPLARCVREKGDEKGRRGAR